jgi:serralysin
MGILTNRANYQDIDGVLWGWQWAPNQANGHTLLYYSFPTSTADYGYGVSGFQPFNGEQQVAAHRAIANVDAVCNLDFVYITDGASANIRFAEADSVNVGTDLSVETAIGLAPDDFHFVPASHGDAWFNHTDYNSPVMGNFEYYAGVLHEMGHALGLRHGHDSAHPVRDSSGNLLYTGPALPAAHDGLEYSVMTYRSYPGASPELGLPDEGPSTLMQNDILALQWMYGANYSCNSNNTTYRWNNLTGEMSTNGVREGVPYHHKVLMTIWDGGGVDTYDFSNFATPATIDLRPGGWSTPSRAMLIDLDYRANVTHLARGCIANALAFANEYRGYIENAWGGSGSDRLIGNELRNDLRGNNGNDTLFGAAGSDTLRGMNGNDVLIGSVGTDAISGGAGNDRFVFNAPLSSANRDTIMDFANVSGNNDAIGLENAVMTRLGAGAHALSPAFFRAGPAALDANDFVIYNRASGALSYDVNGNLAGGAILLATLTTRPVLTAGDFVVI